jgi:tRNA1(Val) A37 N6-methylase TrmN6
MTCSCSSFCGAAEEQFTEEKAHAELRHYRRKGPGSTTRLLRDGLTRSGLIDGALLDIGSGIGALTFELLDQGMKTAIALDASRAYVASARAEAERRGMSDRVRLIHADFLTVAEDLPTATVVTLDRVVCCYPLYQPLLEQAIAHAERALAFSYPHDRWYVRIATLVENAMRTRRCPFRTFVHSSTRMTRIIERAGFELVRRQATLIWCVDVFARVRQDVR